MSARADAAGPLFPSIFAPDDLLAGRFRIVRFLARGAVGEVYEAEDGASGLEAFTHHMPDIVLTDWAMPIFDGLELAQMIRQPGANSNPYVPIIMLTGHSEKKRVVAARDLQVARARVALLPDLLRRRVRRDLRRRRSSSPRRRDNRSERRRQRAHRDRR